jgi:PBSX family phage terminase large subunit
MLAPLTGKGLRSYELATARLNIWEGAVRSAKTVSSLVAWIRFVRTAPAGNLLMVGRTERTLKRNVIDELVERLGPKRARYVAGSGELWLCGRRIYTAGANDEQAAKKIQGLTLVGAYVDEASTIPESFWSMLTTRLSVEGAQLFATSNPDNPSHWLKRVLDRARLWLTGDGQLIERHDPDLLDLHRYSFRLTDNPHLPAAYIAALKAENVGLWYRRLILGEWVRAEGAVYDMFDPAQHVSGNIPIVTRWPAAGVDYGTSNPFHAVVIGLGVDRRLHVASDWRYDGRAMRRQLTHVDYSQRLRAWLARVPIPTTDLTGVTPELVAIDPSEPSFRLQCHRDGLTSVWPADNAVIDGIRTVSSLLATDAMRIHPSCIHLIDEMASYAWDEKASAKGEDKPLKVDDHGVDALRYALHTSSPRWRNQVRQAA